MLPFFSALPELTAVDMVAYQEHIGGLTRAATVLEELSLKLDFTKLDPEFETALMFTSPSGPAAIHTSKSSPPSPTT